jgi:hypothetical protein
MRRYTLMVFAVALFFAIGMMAQTSSGTSGSSQYPSGSDQTSTQSGSQAESSSSMSQKGKEKTIAGCIVRQQTDYYIYPKSGAPQRISTSGENVSEHLGHEVKLHGTEQPSSQASATSPTPGGTAGMAGSTSTQTGSGTGTTGSMAGNTAATGTGSAAASSQEFVVSRVQMVSESCPASIKKNAQSSGMSLTPQ